MSRIATTWDGVAFGQMPQSEAEKLEKEDKVQVLRDGFIDGLSLKYRHQFTGYKTRELRAEKPEPKAAPAEEPEAEKPKAKRGRKKKTAQKSAK